MDRPLVVLILASLAGLGAMMASAHYLAPPSVPLSHLAAHVGTTVQVDARLLQVRVYDSGWTRALLAADNRTVPLVSDQPPAANPGDHVRATGVPQRRTGLIELHVARPRDVTVLSAWSDSLVPLSRLLNEPWNYRDANVQTLGTYERAGPTASLRDGPHRVRLAEADSNDLDAGRRYVVDGRFAYDATTATFRLQLHEARAPPP